MPDPALAARATHAYAQQNREAQEQQWIVGHLPMVRHIVQKICAQFSHHVDMEELVSAGTLGLVKAARAYDTSHDAEFGTYAYIRVRGAVIDELRKGNFAPAAVHTQIRAVNEALARMAAQLGRPPSDEELAAEMNLPVNDLYHLMQEARRQHFLCIHGLSDETSLLEGLTPVDEAPSAQDQLERKELAQQLATALSEMPTRDRHILMLYYERDLTMKEVAQVLNVTESRVSQLHAAALVKLSARMKTKLATGPA